MQQYELRTPLLQPRAMIDTSSMATLVLESSGRRLAIPTAMMRGLAWLVVTPPLPGGVPWAAALADHDGSPVLIIAPFGASVLPSPCQVALLLDRVSGLAIGVAVEGAGRLESVVPLPAAGRLSAACPSSWLLPVQLGAERLPCLDPRAVVAAMAVAA